MRVIVFNLYDQSPPLSFPYLIFSTFKQREGVTSPLSSPLLPPLPSTLFSL